MLELSNILQREIKENGLLILYFVVSLNLEVTSNEVGEEHVKALFNASELSYKEDFELEIKRITLRMANDNDFYFVNGFTKYLSLFMACPPFHFFESISIKYKDEKIEVILKY